MDATTAEANTTPEESSTSDAINASSATNCTTTHASNALQGLTSPRLSRFALPVLFKTVLTATLTTWRVTNAMEVCTSTRLQKHAWI